MWKLNSLWKIIVGAKQGNKCTVSGVEKNVQANNLKSMGLNPSSGCYRLFGSIGTQGDLGAKSL